MDTEASAEASSGGHSSGVSSGLQGPEQGDTISTRPTGLPARVNPDLSETTEDESFFTPATTESDMLDLDDTSESQGREISLPLPSSAPPLFHTEGALDVNSPFAPTGTDPPLPSSPTTSPSSCGTPKPDVEVIDEQRAGWVSLDEHYREKRRQKEQLADIMRGLVRVEGELDLVREYSRRMEQRQEEMKGSPPAWDYFEGLDGGLRGKRSEPSVHEGQVLQGQDNQWQGPQGRVQTAGSQRTSRSEWGDIP